MTASETKSSVITISNFFFILLISSCILTLIISPWTVNERAALPQILQKFTDVEKVAREGSSNVSVSRKIVESVDADVPLPELHYISQEKLFEEEKDYYHDNQYLMYQKCPTSVRLKIANNSLVKHKYIEDMPILMWDKHLTPSEYKRMFRFVNINGFKNMSYKDLSSMIHKLTSENNRYMFDDLLHAKEKDCIRCAIIGNGGILNGSKMGAEIDAHDYVFRVNTALTKGFEEDVGTKTSFYCFTMTTLRNTLVSSSQFGFKAPPLIRSPPKFSIPLTPENVKIVHPDFERYLKWSWVNSTHQHKDIHRPTTGAIMLLVALHTCDEVNAYGFGGDYTKYSDHYYEKTFSKHTFYANHDDKIEQKMWHMLNEQNIIKLYTRDDEKS